MFIFGRNNNIKLLKNGNTSTLEYAIWRYTIRNKPIHIIGMYHPPPNGEHNTTNGMFINDITELLVNNLPQYQNNIILGDFNIHIEDLTNVAAIIFNDTMRALGLEQHISGQTHVRGKHLRSDLCPAKQWLQHHQYHITWIHLRSLYGLS